jgi:signal transduction histidine kinase
MHRNKDLEQFAYIISHNLRSPVANITGLSNMILNNSELDAGDQKKCLEGLALSVKKLDDVIIDLNYILQVRREINEKKEMVKFSEIVNDIKTSINNLIQKEEVNLTIDFSQVNESFTLKSYLNSIFYNLISNSIKYRNPLRKPVITITSQKVNDKTRIMFSDNGLGIDLDTNGNKIFGLYKKFHSHTDGKGMGLFMVKTQVEILGGKISIDSEVDKGTTFTIDLDA